MARKKKSGKAKNKRTVTDETVAMRSPAERSVPPFRAAVANGNGTPDQSGSTLNTQTETGMSTSTEPKAQTVARRTTPLQEKTRSELLQAVRAANRNEDHIPLSESDKVKPLSPVSSNMAKEASLLLFVATAIGILFGAAMLFLEGGNQGVPAMGGMLDDTQVPELTARIVFFLDLLFPIAFGGGLALLATSLQTRGNRPLVRLLLTAVLVGVTFDFMENALVFSTLTGEEPYVLRWPITVLKYASLALASVLLSTIMMNTGALAKLVQLILRYVFPVSVAALLSGIGGITVRDLVGASFPISLLLLAFYARQISNEPDHNSR